MTVMSRDAGAMVRQGGMQTQGKPRITIIPASQLYFLTNKNAELPGRSQ